MRRGEDKFLEPLRGPAKRKRFVVYDLESKADDTQQAGFTRPFLVGFYDGDTFLPFRNARVAELSSPKKYYNWDERFWKEGGCIDRFLRYALTSNYRNCHFYAHNGGSFDHLFLLAWLREHSEEFDFEITPVQSSIQKLDVWRRKRKRDGRWTFLDSMRLLPMGLDRAAKTFGLSGKGGMDLNAHEEDPTWLVYLKIDCIQLYKVMEKAHELIENKLGGEVGMTAPSTSMKLYRRKYLGREGSPRRIPRYRHFAHCTGQTPTGETCPGCAHQWIRKAYYGGRTEILRMQGEGLRYYDINSSYAAAMCEDMPIGDRLVDESGRLDWRFHDTHIGFVECTVHIPETCKLPPLPYRADSGKLIFPIGTFSGVWDTEELKLLFDSYVQGSILSVKRVVWFRRKKAFDKMVKELYRLRDKELSDYDEGLSALGKLLVNAFYGKFGMREERTSIVLEKPRSETEGTCFLCEKPVQAKSELCSDCEGSIPASPTFDSRVWYQKKEVSAGYIIPQIAAHITTLARVRIWRFMREAYECGGEVYYSDTDSLLTDVELPSSKALGELKDEYPGETLRGRFLQPKVYILEKETPFSGEHESGCLKDKAEPPCQGCSRAKLAMKGFPREARTMKHLKELEAKCEVTFARLEKVRSLARRGFLDSPKMVTVKKSFRSAYDKRHVNPDGSTSPIVLHEALPEAAE